jgi:hypothetical protein
MCRLSCAGGLPAQRNGRLRRLETILSISPRHFDVAALKMAAGSLRVLDDYAHSKLGFVQPCDGSRAVIVPASVSVAQSWHKLLY